MKIDREKVWLKYDKHCAYCGNELEFKNMQVDHLFPKTNENLYQATGNRLEYYKNVMGLIGNDINCFENLMPSCRRCNHYKRASSLKSFRYDMKTIHKRFSEIYIVKVAIDYGIIKVNQFDGIFYFEKFNTSENIKAI